jgi:hypothetical protein
MLFLSVALSCILGRNARELSFAPLRRGSRYPKTRRVEPCSFRSLPRGRSLESGEHHAARLRAAIPQVSIGKVCNVESAAATKKFREPEARRSQ